MKTVVACFSSQVRLSVEVRGALLSVRNVLLLVRGSQMSREDEPPDVLLTVREVATCLRVHPSTARRSITHGELEAVLLFEPNRHALWDDLAAWCRAKAVHSHKVQLNRPWA